jgi:hypothetical protein
VIHYHGSDGAKSAFDGNAASSETAHPRGRFGGRIAVQHTLSGCARIRYSTVTDPQAGEFCHQQPHNIALNRAEPQDRNECKTIGPERDLTFDGNVASSQMAHPRRRSDGNIAAQHTHCSAVRTEWPIDHGGN